MIPSDPQWLAIVNAEILLVIKWRASYNVWYIRCKLTTLRAESFARKKIREIFGINFRDFKIFLQLRDKNFSHFEIELKFRGKNFREVEK